jgi:hypothetical protein
MSVGKFREEKRNAEKFGHMTALGEFRNADKIHLGDQCIVKGKVIRRKLVLMGDGHYIFGNHIETKDECGIHIV